MTHAKHHDVAHEGRPPRKKSHRELFAAFASGFVASLALATSTYNVYLQRQYVRAQAFPRLVWDMSLTKDGFVMTVTNRGVGPAEVRRIRVSVDDERMPDWLAAERKLLRRRRVLLPELLDVSTTLSPGLDITAFAMRDDDTARELMTERRRLDVEICYCSSLDECWAVGARGMAANVTRPVGECVPDPEPFLTIDEASLDAALRALAAAAEAEPRADAGTNDGTPSATSHR